MKVDASEQLDYYLESLDAKKVFICPRVWCVKDNIPVDPIFSDEKFNFRCVENWIKLAQRRII